MVEAVAPVRSRRLPFWAIIIALVISALGGVFVLLWFKLPTWAPEWVVEHSPWVDPIVRAVEGGLKYEDRQRAVQRIAGMGSAAAPRLLSVIEIEESGLQEFTSEVFAHLQDDRVIAPMITRILIPEKSDPGFVSSAPPANDVWVAPLRNQRPAAVADLLLPHFHPGVEIPYQLLDVAGGVDDPRLVEPLRQILRQPWNEDYWDPRKPPFRAAKALADSPCASAIPVLVESFSDHDPIIRWRVNCGIVMATWPGGRFVKSDWDVRLKDVIIEGFFDSDSKVRTQAANSVGHKPIDGVEEHLLRLSHASDPRERGAAIYALRSGKPSPLAQARIIALLKDPDPGVCQQSVYGIDSVDDPAAVTGDLLDLLTSPSERVRELVCSTLSRKNHRHDARIFPAMLAMMDDPSFSVVRRAEQTAWGAVITDEQKAAAKAKSDEVERRRAGSGRP